MSSNLVEQDNWKPKANPLLIALAVMLATFMVVLDSSIANVALPKIAGSFSATQDESLWILTSYLIAEGIILPTTAWFSGLLGRKRLLIICICIFTCASLLCGISTSMGMIVIARIIQGLGGGALMPISQSILLESFPKEKHGIAMSIFGLGVVLAPVIGPTLGGWITDNYSWHWIFLINLPVGMIAIMLSHMFIEDPPYLRKSEIKKIDYTGFSALVIWLVSLQLVLDNGQKSDWFAAPWVCWTTSLSIFAMVFFFVWELKFKDSIIDLRVFKDRNYAIGTLLNTFISAILYSTLAILPLFLQNLIGYSAFHSGMAISPRGIGCIIAIAMAGLLSNKVDERIMIAFGLILLGFSSFMFGDLNLEIAITNIIIPNFICGMALGFTFIPLTTISFSTLKNHQMTNATGLQNLLKNIGGAIGTSVVATSLSRTSQVHQVYMVGHLNSFNPAFQAKLNALTSFFSIHMHPVVAATKANYLMYTTLMKQASLWSFIDNFRLYGFVCLLLVPTVIIFKKVKSKPKDETVITQQ